MSWFTWFGRAEEKRRAYERLESLRQQYGAHGERVIKLSARTDLARRSAGATRAAFDFVERVFAAATSEYAKAGELLEAIEAGLLKGRVGDLPGAEKALKGVGSQLDELERHLERWESLWQQVPHAIADAERSVAELKAQVERASERLGAPLPVASRVANLEQHLEKIRQTLAAGNPVEANHLVGDLQLALDKVGELAGQYLSAIGAIDQAESDLARARERLAARPDAPAEAVGALAAAEALLARLRPSLTAGNLEQFQHDLLHLQRSVAAVKA